MDQLEEVFKEYRNGVNGTYDIQFIKEVVRLAQGGLSYQTLCSTYNIERRSIYRWVMKYGSKEYARSRKQVSRQDKRAAVRAIETGKLTVREAMTVYGVSDTTIRNWKNSCTGENTELSFSNQEHLNKKKNKKQAGADSEKVHQLEQQLADAQLKVVALNTLIDVAEEKLKINIRKKPGARQS